MMAPMFDIYVQQNDCREYEGREVYRLVHGPGIGQVT